MARVDPRSVAAGEHGKNALAEIAAGKAGGGKSAAPGGWRPLQLDRHFSLETAVDQAMSRATRQLNWSLQPEGVVVRLPQTGGESGLERTVDVLEGETDKVLKTYNAMAFLGLYAAREKANGVIVDGQI